jgi:membrane protease YdiL (CAAX protease family)
MSLFYDFGLTGEEIFRDFKFFAGAVLSQILATTALIRIHNIIPAFKHIIFGHFMPDRKTFLSGLIIGILFPLIIVLILLISNQIYYPTGNHPDYFSILFIGPLFFFAFVEEFFFRFYLLNRLNYELNFKTSIIISSLFFSLFHSFNSSITWLSFVNLFLAGMIFSIIYIQSGENLIWVTTIHALWNFSSGTISGGYVSGIRFDAFLGTIHFSSSNFINGGLFGIEGSIVTTFFLSGYIIFFHFARKGEIQMHSYNV